MVNISGCLWSNHMDKVQVTGMLYTEYLIRLIVCSFKLETVKIPVVAINCVMLAASVIMYMFTTLQLF